MQLEEAQKCAERLTTPEKKWIVFKAPERALKYLAHGQYLCCVEEERESLEYLGADFNV